MIVVSDATVMSERSGISACRYTGPLMAATTGTSMFNRLVKSAFPCQYVESQPAPGAPPPAGPGPRPAGGAPAGGAPRPAAPGPPARAAAAAAAAPRP